METKETMACKYVDKFGIFTEQVDIDALHDTILNDFIPCLPRKNLWYAVWHTLKDNNCLKRNVSRLYFGKQMLEWFPEDYSPNCLDAYAATILTCTPCADWDDKFFKTFEERYKKDIKKGRLSVNTAKNMYYLYNRFKPIIEEKSIKKNTQS